MNKKALIAMSGGVDSSVAAYLMKQDGFDCAGITMKLFDNDDIEYDNNKSCCSLEDAQDAKDVAYRLGMPHYVLNFTDEFKKQVIDRFVTAYQNCLTPNPCIDCNRHIKFEKLFLRAKQLEMDCIVTGHYASIEYQNGRYLLKKAADKSKDQSYVLYSMTQEQLKHTLFPLGELTKSAVRDIAQEQGFINAAKKDSQDICFIKSGEYYEFIEKYTGKKYPEGNFIDLCGNILGRHKGLIRYTIGQRKGLGLALSHSMYVYSKNAEDNTVTLCDSEELFTKSLTATDFNWISCNESNVPSRVKAKVRYSQSEQWARVSLISPTMVNIEFDEPQRAITKGQAVVLYDGDIVVGGGTII